MVQFDRQYIGIMIQAIEEDPYLGLELANQIAEVYLLLNTESADGRFVESWGHATGGPDDDNADVVYEAMSMLLSSIYPPQEQANVLLRLNSDFVAKAKSKGSATPS